MCHQPCSKNYEMNQYWNIREWSYEGDKWSRKGHAQQNTNTVKYLGVKFLRALFRKGKDPGPMSCFLSAGVRVPSSLGLAKSSYRHHCVVGRSCFSTGYAQEGNRFCNPLGPALGWITTTWTNPQQNRGCMYFQPFQRVVTPLTAGPCCQKTTQPTSGKRKYLNI